MSKVRLSLFLGGIISVFSLSGCANQQQILNEYKEKCRGFGFAEGTAQFSECIEKQDLEEQRDSAIMLSSPGFGGSPWW